MRNSIILLIISSLSISKVFSDISECIGDCSEGEMFIPNKLCSKFCVCDNGRPVEMSCPADLHFSPEHHVCMNPSDANCNEEIFSIRNNNNFIINNSSIHNNNNFHNTHTNNNNINYYNNKNPTIVPAKASCYGECGPSINYLVHEDSNKFCLCYYGNKIIMECQSGAHFVPQLNNCIKGTDLEEHDVRKNECIGSCPEDMQSDVIYLLPHENCNKYCVCILGYPVIIHNCAPDMLYSYVEKRCVDAKLAKCANPDYNPKIFQLSFY